MWLVDAKMAPVLHERGIVLTAGERDRKTHAEIFEEGEYADVVFAVAGRDSEGKPSPRASLGGNCLKAELEVYGLKPVFALASRKFQEIMEGPAAYVCQRPGKDRLWLLEGYWIPARITPIAFEVVACYIYKLPLRLSLSSLHEVIEAASCLELPELNKACYDFGLRQYDAETAEEGLDIDAMLRCLEAWHRNGAEETFTGEWQRRLFGRWSQEKVLNSSVFARELQSRTMFSLLLSDEMHKDETALWNATLAWAKARWEAGARAPDPEPKEEESKPLVGGSIRLFGPAAYQKPRERCGPESEWQRLLLPLSKCFQLHRLSPEAFALGLEGMATGDESPGLIPELRGMLYAARRQAKQMVATPAKAV